MNITTINESVAPVATPKVSSVNAELVAALRGLVAGEVLRITPDAGKTIRGTKTGIGRIANGANIETTSWDDGSFIYVRVNTADEVEAEADDFAGDDENDEDNADA